ncbi:MAG: hypothetical protein ACRDWA_16750 [Acidimicrobiia bacterium]
MATYPQDEGNRKEREKLTWQPDDFEELGSELRRRMGAEMRDEAEEVERLSDLQRRRRNSLAETARTAMHRGDSVTIAIGERAWKGTLRAVGEDYLRLESSQIVVECPLAAVVVRTERSRSGGQSGKPASATWRARLAELAAEKMTVHVLVRGSTDILGIIEVVATDHIEVAAEYPTYIPLGLVEAITFVP